MNFKSALLLCLISTHAVARDVQDFSFFALNRAIVDSDPKTVATLLPLCNCIPEQMFLDFLETADALIKSRRQDIDTFLLACQRDEMHFISLSNQVPQIPLPPQYAARCGEAGLAEAAGVGCSVGLFISLCAMMKSWRFYWNNREFQDSNRSLAVLVFTTGVTGLLASLTYACFYEAHHCKAAGLKPYKWVCREYLEDMYKNALQVKQLIVEKMAHASQQ